MAYIDTRLTWRMRSAAGWIVVGWLLSAGSLWAAEELRQPAPTSGGEFKRMPHCSKSGDVSRWFKPIDQISVNIRPAEGVLPLDCSEGLFIPADKEPRPEAACWSVFYWVPTNMAHQPAYWDEIPLERYGQSVCPIAQPFLSGAHFFTVFPLIPYKIGIDGTHELVYTLGYYRIGDCAPPVRQRLPWEVDAALLEAGVWTGLIYAFP
jgi:hypothetical protein